MTNYLLKRPLAFLILERKLEINYGTSFLEIAEIQKEEIFSERWGISSTVWMLVLVDRGWNWSGQIGQSKIVIINIDRFQVGLTFANFGKAFFKLTVSCLISNVYITHWSKKIYAIANENSSQLIHLYN